ncbi:MAG TPA: IS110 family transposase [Chloroflexi bacterium]|nr:IS110 family transposase [Chloroflexota bacterium]
MISVGIDIGKRSHEVCLMDAEGHQIGKFIRFQHSREGMTTLVELLRRQSEPCIIALEATGHYWLALYHHLLQDGFKLVTVNPLQSHAYRRSTIRKVKNDRRDAWIIADLLRIGRVRPGYVPGPDIQPLRDLARFRMELVDQVGDAKRRILGVLDKVFPEYESFFSSIFIATSKELLKRAATAEEFAALDLKEITQVVTKASRGRLGLERAEKLQQAARTSLGLPYLRDAATVELRCLLAQVEFLESQVKATEEAINKLFSQVSQHLTSIKGIGIMSAAAIYAEIGDIHRFSTPESLVAYAGIDPTIFSSGEFEGTKRHMSKRGSPYLRKALWMAATGARRWNPDLDVFFTKKLQEGKSYGVAMGALCHKLLGRIYVILKENRPYEVR